MRVVPLSILFAVAVAATVAAEDSPLVQAAKRTKPLREKPAGAVITNKTLAKKGGHVTTTYSRKAAAPVTTKTSVKPTTPVEKKGEPEVAKPAEIVASAEPIEDRHAKEPEDCNPENIVDPGVIVKVPAIIAAKPQLTQPPVTAPSPTPPYTPPLMPQVTPPVTPPYTPFTPTPTVPPVVLDNAKPQNP